MDSQSDNIIRFPGALGSDVESDAATWLARMTSGVPTLAELAEFEFWRAASPDHDRVYREMEAMWDRLGAGTARRSIHRRLWAGLRRSDRAGWVMRFAGIAAAILVAVMVGQYVSTWRYDYYTAPGEIRRVTLADGSIVHMKGGTALDARVSGSGARTIDLARGEAFFEVVHDAARPFSVKVGNGAVHDIGTGFSVARTGRSVTVEVEHGIVSVAAAGLSDILTAGERVSFTPYNLGRKTTVDTAMISPWRRGLYIAEGKRLSEVLGEIDEYHPGRIIVTSRTLAARRVNAVVQFGHTDAWLDALGQTRGVSVQRWGPLIIIGDRSG